MGKTPSPFALSMAQSNRNNGGAMQENIPEKIFHDLDTIYDLALESGKLAVALKVKELMGKEYGLFSGKNKNARLKGLALDSLSTEDLSRLVQKLENQLNLDPHKPKE
jgi:hypothetical protein